VTTQQRAAPVAARNIHESSPVSNVVEFAHYAGTTRRSPTNRIIALGYGAVVYGIFLGTLLYAIGFVGCTLVPKSIDTASGGWPTPVALCIDLQLLAILAVQHSGMARPGFKRMLAAHVSPAIERSTYLLCASLAMILLFAAWQPLPAVVWQVSNPQLAMMVDGVALCGWLMVLTGTWLVSRFELFGLKLTSLGFIAAFWSASTMTAGHLLFAAVATGTIFIRIRLEERDLMATVGHPSFAPPGNTPSHRRTFPVRSIASSPISGRRERGSHRVQDASARTPVERVIR
jgi:protein-S-isoprenylcysteine O-methyltransferase Ste14